LIYPSSLSRGQIKKLITEKENHGESWPKDPDGTPLYPGCEKELSKTEHIHLIANSQTYALRIDMEKAAEKIGHEISWIEMGFEKPIIGKPLNWGDVGKDLYHATSIHILLYELLDLKTPLYHHHKLILDDNSDKLSKSKAHTSLMELRQSLSWALSNKDAL